MKYIRLCKPPFAIALLALLVLLAATALPAFAASYGITVTGLNPTQIWGGYPPVPVANVSLTASGVLYGATVTITGNYVPGDTLATTACGALTCSYAAPTLTLSGAGTPAEYASAMSGVVFSTTATGASAGGDRTITYSIDVTVMPGYFKCAGIANHYYYHYTASYKKWTEARTEALNYSYLGYTGYLVHLNSQSENDCVQAQYGGQKGWIGFYGNTQTGPYDWVDGPTTDNPPVYTAWGSGQPANKPSQVYTYMDGSSGTWYNVLDDDSSPGSYIVEFGNPAEDTGFPKTGTAIVHVVEPPNLTVGLAASNAQTVPTDGWTWTITIQNSKYSAAAFHDGDTLFQDDLPSTGAAYGTPHLLNVTNVTNGNNLVCAISNSTLTCKAIGADVAIGGTNGRFDVQFTVTAATAGTFSNPRAGGMCQVDPNNVIIEWDGTTSGDLDNACSHTAYVAVLQRGLNSYAGVVDTYILSHPGKLVPAGLSSEIDVRGKDTAATLISFDLSGQLTTGATIRSASEWLYLFGRCNQTYWSSTLLSYICSGDSSTSSLSIRAYQLLRTWNETEATWTNATAKVKWMLPGANKINKDRAGKAVASSTWSSLGWKPLNLTALAQTWVAAPATNFGILIDGDEQGLYPSRMFRLYSSDYITDTTKRPNLHIVSW